MEFVVSVQYSAGPLLAGDPKLESWLSLKSFYH